MILLIFTEMVAANQTSGDVQHPRKGPQGNEDTIDTHPQNVGSHGLGSLLEKVVQLDTETGLPFNI